MLYLILISFLLVFILMVYYLIRQVNKSYLINKINNKKIKYSINSIILVIIVIFLFFNMTNTMIIIIHLFVILLLFNFIFYIIEKIFNKKTKYNISLIISILLTTIYMIHGYYLANNIVQTNYTLFTDKISTDFRIIEISDTHIGTTINGNEFKNYITKFNDLNPDIVVITGDFIDDSTSYDDMVKSVESLSLLNTKYGVYFVYGNHDKGYFNNRRYTKEDFKNLLIKNNVKVLEDNIVNINEEIILIGRQDHQVSNRSSIKDLVKEIDKNKYIIVLDHQPRDYKNESESGVDLVLSGHTHGGQFIPIGPISVLLNINDGYYGLSKRNNTNFIITSGMSNWAFKFKTGCISEYVVIDIKNML